MGIKTLKQWNTLIDKARLGDAEVQWEVGYHFEEGVTGHKNHVIVKPEPIEALHWYTLSAMQGNSCAQIALGRLFSGYEGIPCDFKAAIYWTKKALKQGDPSAAHNLGSIYRDLQKPRIAFKCYKLALEMGDLDSLLEVGLCHFFGYGTKKNHHEAYLSIKKIAEMESINITRRSVENALYWLGIFRLIGIGPEKKSIEEARRYLEAANRDDDHEQANELLNLIGKTKYIIHENM